MKIFTSEVEMFRAECKEWEKVCEQHLRYIDKLKKQLKKSLEQPEHDCARSHPHEEMNKECELRAEIARLTNKLAQRTWVGLTDEEIEMIVENKRTAHWEFIRQVEAKLKEKNT
jgi:predicted HicB family RNase H-like nuclease